MIYGDNESGWGQIENCQISDLHHYSLTSLIPSSWFPGYWSWSPAHYYVNKSLCSQGYGFSSGHVWMWELYCKKSWIPKNWCSWTVVLEETLECPLDCKEIQPVHPKGNQSWMFTGKTDAEAEIRIFWLPDAKSWLIWKTLMLGKFEGRKRRGWQRMRWLNGSTHSMDMNMCGLRELVMNKEALEVTILGLTKSWTRLKKQESSRKIFISALLTMPKPLTVWITINSGKFWKRWEYQTTRPAFWETYTQVRKSQLELDMEQQTGSK